MADDNNKDKERIKLLEEQNRLYKKQLELQEEGYSLSTSYVESLKEVLGIRSRLSTADSNLLSLNKKINKEILDQKIKYENISDIQKQIKKNNELIEKSSKLEQGLANSISKERQKQVDKTAKAFQLQNDLSKSIEDAYQQLERGEQVNLDILKSKEAQLAAVEKETNRRVELLSSEEKKLVYIRLQKEELEKQNEERDKEKQKLEEIEKKLGIFGGILKGIGKIPIIGDLVDTEKALKVAREEVERTGSGVAGLKAGLSNLKGQFISGLLNPANLVLGAIIQLIAAFKSVDKGIGELAKGLDMSYNSATNLRMELTDIANSSGDVAVNTKGLQESLLAVGTQMGINARLSAQDLVTFTKLREQAGYTNDELVAIQKISTINNKTVGDTSKAFLGTVARLNAQNKLAINAKQLFKEIVNVSDAIKLSVGGTAEKIAEAAFKAKQFGITLQQADNIAESLLNFESSISNELSAELITGKNLNFERARLLAINGDIAGASAEILQQVGGTAEFTKMNRIQQEAIAKSVGMTRDDLAKSLVDREAAAKLGAQEGQAAQDRYNELVKQYGVEKANAMLGDEALAKQFQQQSIQERLNASIEKMKELFVNIAEPLLQILSPIMDLVNTILGPIFKILQPIFGILKAIAAVVAGIVKFITFDFSGGIESFKSIGNINWFGSDTSSMKDGIIDMNKGPVVSGGFGSVQLSDKDTAVFNGKSIVAGTNLGGKGNPSPTPAPQQDLSPLLNEMKALRQEQAKSNSKPTVVENSMNGTKFGTSVAMNTYKIQ